VIQKIRLKGDNMSTRTLITQSTLFIVVIFLSTALFILALSGCASTPSGPGPGTPDEIQLQHYEMVKSAIEAKDRINALAALALFEADIFRWHTNTLTEAVAITELLALTDAVDKEEWASANKMLIDLKSKYRPE
jgi:hypothetical protein